MLRGEPCAERTLGKLGKPPERSGITQSEAVLPRAKRNYPVSP